MQHKAEEKKARITAGREEKEVHHYTILRATSQSFVDPPNDRVELSPYGAHPPNTGTVQYGAGQGERNSFFIDSGSAPFSLLGEEEPRAGRSNEMDFLLNETYLLEHLPRYV